MPGSEGELEASVGLGGEPSFGFLRDVRGVIVKDQLDRGAGRIGSIEKPEELDELPAAVALADQGMNLPGKQVYPCQQTNLTASQNLSAHVSCD